LNVYWHIDGWMINRYISIEETTFKARYELYVWPQMSKILTMTSAKKIIKPICFHMVLAICQFSATLP